MIPLDLATIARATGGRLVDGARPTDLVTGPVVIDSREAAAGALFACIPGASADGHDFAADAVGRGAVAVLATRPVGVPALLVDDAATALAAVARAVLAAAPGCTVVGVTGSTGKTSTKDLLAQTLAVGGPVVAPRESFNNELGLPLTVCRVDASTATLVAEYSARGVGHIRYLCGIAPPRVGIVLNVGVAHLGEFGSRAAIAQAKGELVEALPDDGLAVLNADDELVAAMRTRTAARVLTFGSGRDADVRTSSVRLDEASRPAFRLETPVGSGELQLSVPGRHQVANAAAVVTAAVGTGLALDPVLDALSQATITSRHRMAVQERADGVVVVDDAYNANPESVRAALDAVSILGRGRRRWAVLGEMLELGPESARMHAEVGAAVAASGVDELVGVGTVEPLVDAAAAAAGWAGRARLVADDRAASRLLEAEVRPGDVVLVKGSNSLRLWRIAERLLATPSPAGAGR